jgi:hypothetical protein
MNSQAIGLRVAGIVFGLVSVAQLVRLLVGADVSVAGHSVPLLASAAAFVIAGGLSFWMCRLSYRGTN